MRQSVYNKKGERTLMHPVDAAQALATGKYFLTPPAETESIPEPVPDTNESESDAKNEPMIRRRSK